jgi:hypothetical protein
MRRFMTWTTAVMVVAAGFALMNENEATAGLFKKKCKPKCCPVSCCQPAPCCAPAPCCPEPCGCAPACGCAAPADPCGCQAAAPCGCECQQLTRREIRKAKRAGCCVQQCSCPSPCASSPCGCEGGAAPASPEAAPELPGDAST